MRHRIRLDRLQRPVSVLLLALVVGLGIGRMVAALLAPAAHAGPVVRASSKRSLPPSLLATASAAEDVAGLALRGERARAVAEAAELRASARGPDAAVLRRAGAPASEVSLLEKRADRVAHLAPRAPFIRIALAANAVSGLMPVFYARFAGTVPAGIAALGYLDREALLRSRAGEQPAVRATVAELGLVWRELRPDIAAGAPESADRYGAHVAAMERLARDKTAALQREAARGLDLVAVLWASLQI